MLNMALMDKGVDSGESGVAMDVNDIKSENGFASSETSSNPSSVQSGSGQCHSPNLIHNVTNSAAANQLLFVPYISSEVFVFSSLSFSLLF